MRIVWLAHRDIKHPRSGGSERTIFEVSKRLVERGHSVKWFSVNFSGGIVQENVSGIDISRCENNTIAHFRIPFLLRRENYDVVIDDLGHAVPWSSELFAKTPGTIMFYHLHRRSLPGQVRFPLSAFLISLERAYPLIYRHWPFVTDSESAMKDLVSLGIDAGRIKTIPLGVENEWFNSIAKSITPTIVYFGGMRDYKRPWEILFAFKHLKSKMPNVHLNIIGSGPSLSKVKSTASQLNILKSIHFYSDLSRERLRQLVGEAWLNVHTSTVEGFGISIAEASASGTPTVAYDVPGVSETIKQGLNGILVENGNNPALYRAMYDLLDDYSSNWIASSKKVAAHYSWDQCANSWESHLNGIIDNESF